VKIDDDRLISLFLTLFFIHRYYFVFFVMVIILPKVIQIEWMNGFQTDEANKISKISELNIEH